MLTFLKWAKRPLGEICFILLLCGVLAASASALIPGTYPILDPTINSDQTLPEEYDFAMEGGMPYGYFALGGDADYSFGVAYDSKGCAYYASFNTGEVIKRYPDMFGTVSILSKTERIKLTGALWAIAIDHDDNIIYCTAHDGKNGGHVGIYNQTTKTRTKLVACQGNPFSGLAVDHNNDILIASGENGGEVLKYERETGKLRTLATNIPVIASVYGAPDGTVYVLSFAVTKLGRWHGAAYQGGILYQITPDGRLETVGGGNAQYVWRGRGITMDDKGYVYVSGEGNAWDNGNSAMVVRYDPRTREMETYCSGIDFSTFVTWGDDGRLYQVAARDDIAVAYSKEAVDDYHLQDIDDLKGCGAIAYGGCFSNAEDATGETVTVQVGSVTLTGRVELAPGSDKVCVWVSVPEESLPELDKKPQDTGGWYYEQPSVDVRAEKGTYAYCYMNKRVHQRSRWPMLDDWHCNEWYSEAPESFMVYFEWTPYTNETWQGEVNPNEFRETTRPTSPAYSEKSLDRMAFTVNGEACPKENGVYALDLSSGAVTAVTRGWESELTFTWIPEKETDEIEFAFDNRGSYTDNEGEGLRLCLKGDGTANLYYVDAWNNIVKSQAVCLGKMIVRDFQEDIPHTLSFVNNFGEYALMLDGVNLLENTSEDIQASVHLLAGGNATYLSISSLSGHGVVTVKKGIDYNALRQPAKNNEEMTMESSVTEKAVMSVGELFAVGLAAVAVIAAVIILCVCNRQKQ